MDTSTALPADPLVLKGECEVKIIKRRRVRIECRECGENAVRRHTYLLPNARSNPASSAYRKDDCSWCSDHEEFTCLACYPEHKHPTVEGYGWCSTFPANERFAHMFLTWKDEPTGALFHAAAEMLAAATAVIQLRDEGHPEGGDLDANVAWRQRERDADKALRAAITKATGAQP